MKRDLAIALDLVVFGVACLAMAVLMLLGVV